MSDRALIITMSFIATAVVAANIYMQTPTHDSMYGLQVFHFLYSAFYQTDHITYWMHDWLFGTPSAHFYRTVISPFHVISFLFGYVFRLTDTLLLFLLAILMATFFVVATTGILVRDMTRSRSAIVFACLACGFSVLPLYQLNLNFMSYVFVPIMLIFIQRFFRTNDASYLIRVALIILLSSVGNAPYQVIIMAMLGSVMIGARLACGSRVCVSPIRLFPDRRSLLFGLLAALMIFVTLTVITLDFFHENTLLSPQRSADGVASREVFLTYGYSLRIAKFLELLLAVGPGLDTTIYVGYMVMALCIYALVFTSLTRWAVLLLPMIVVVGMSLADTTVILPILYYFPMAEYFRHAGLYLGMVRCLAIVFGAYGFAHLLARSDFGHELKKRRGFAAILAGLIALTVSLDFYLGGALPYKPRLQGDAFPLTEFHYVVLFASFIIALLALNRRIAARGLGIAILGALIMDCGSYQHLMLVNRMHSFIDVFRRSVGELRLWDDQRVSGPETSELQAILLLDGQENASIDGLAGLKRCAPHGRWDFIPSPISAVVKLRGHALAPGTWPREDAALTAALGCGKPVIWVPPTVATVPEATAAMQSATDFATTAVITMPGAEPVTAANPAITTRFLQQSANSIALAVRNPSDRGGWLVINFPRFSGWKAFIDDREVSIQPANMAEIGISIPPGPHTVDVSFTPRWRVRFSLWFGFPTAAACVIWLLWTELRRMPGRSRKSGGSALPITG